MEMVTADIFQVHEHYAEHRGKPFFKDLVASMAGEKIIPFVVVRDQGIPWHPSYVVERLRCAVGAASDSPTPGTIREKFQIDQRRNSIHCSSSNEAAVRELKIWFHEL